jgi:hypothetical protein
MVQGPGTEMEAQESGPIPEIFVNLPEGASLEDYKPPSAPIPHKERAASWVAISIVSTFAATLGIILIGGLMLISRRSGAIADPKGLVNDAIVPLLEKAATFSTTVFGPLLAFVLGYYFGERQGT